MIDLFGGQIDLPDFGGMIVEKVQLQNDGKASHPTKHMNITFQIKVEEIMQADPLVQYLTHIYAVVILSGWINDTY